MRLRPAGWMSWQLAGLLTLTSVCGLAVGTLTATIVYLKDAEPLARELNRKTTRIALLEMLVQQQVPETYASLEAGSSQAPSAPADTPVAKPAATAAARAPAPAAPKELPSAPVARPPAHPAAPQRVAGPQRVPAQPTSVAYAQAASPMPPQDVKPDVSQPVTGEELFQAMRARIEGVSGEKAGVKAVEKGAVRLLNGGVVRVGQLFPSGEKLLQVDPDNNRVITNQRQMLLFFQN